MNHTTFWAAAVALGLSVGVGLLLTHPWQESCEHAIAANRAQQVNGMVPPDKWPATIERTMKACQKELPEMMRQSFGGR